MAVQLLEYHLGFPTSQRGNQGGVEVMATGLQSMQHIMNLLTENQMRQAQGACSHIPEAGASDCKKVITRGGGLGHARFRRAPGDSPATRSSLSTPLFQMSAPACSPTTVPSPALIEKPSSSPSQHQDATFRSSHHNGATELSYSNVIHEPQTNFLHADFTYRPCDNDVNGQGDVHHVHKHANMQTNRMSQLDSPCDPLGKREHNVDGSVYDASTAHSSHAQGHARCREVLIQKLEHQISTIKPFSSPVRSNSCFVSSMSVEEKGGTVSSGKPVYSSGRPPLPPKKRKTPEEFLEIRRNCHSAMQCHCAHKRRKLKSRTMAKVSVSGATGLDIPADGYSWCTYGQKLVEGSPYPRVYYKCSSVRSCPARKHVQRAPEDRNIFLVTYGRKHTHPQIDKVANLS